MTKTKRKIGVICIVTAIMFLGFGERCPARTKTAIIKPKGDVVDSAVNGQSNLNILSLPNEVIAITETKTFKLKSSDMLFWAEESVSVKLSRTANGFTVDVSSGENLLKSVSLVWNYPHKDNAKYLGDAWERAYGDLGWKEPDPDRVMPWYVMEYDPTTKTTSGFGVMTGCRSMCYWKISDGKIQLVMNTQSGGKGVKLGQRVLRAAEVVSRKSAKGESSYKATQKFCKMMCPKPRLPKDTMVGYLDYYFTYGKCTKELFLEQSKLLAQLVDGCGVKAFSLVDCGWAAWHDDEIVGCDRFGDMSKVASGVRGYGLVPGIWTRPLRTSSKTPKRLRSMRNGSYLDPSLPENLARVSGLMKLFRQWGFDVIKHDFTTNDIFGRWGFKMKEELTDSSWTFRDNTKTSAEVILDFYRAIREGCGDDAVVISCNGVSHLSAGIFEYYRVGDDSANNLKRAIKFGPNALSYRLPQNKTFYAVDPDCINLSGIPWWYNTQFMELTANSGALFCLSTRMESLSDDHKTYLRKLIRRIGKGEKTVEAIDWMEKSPPGTWMIDNEVIKMDWNQ